MYTQFLLRRVRRSASVSHRINLWGVFGVTSVPSLLYLTKGGRLEQGPEPELDFLLRIWLATTRRVPTAIIFWGAINCARCTEDHPCRQIVFLWVPHWYFHSVFV